MNEKICTFFFCEYNSTKMGSVNLISFLKKIVIIFITVAAVFFLFYDVLLIYKGKISSAIFVKSPPLIMRELALAKKPPIKKEPVIEKTVVTQPVKRQAIFA